MGQPSRFRWTSAALTHVGLVRVANEDTLLDNPSAGLWAVADGMGGHAFGDVASQLVIAALQQLAPSPTLDATIHAVKDVLQASNRQLRTEALRRQVRLIGSTVVVLLAHDQHGACLWAGDSRLYRYGDGKLSRLTRDHSTTEQFNALASGAGLDRTSPPPRNLITRAVGTANRLDLDCIPIDVVHGDRFLLCSDGLSNEVSEAEICDALRLASCALATDALVNSALRHGGRDNISVIVVNAEDLCASDLTVLNPEL